MDPNGTKAEAFDLLVSTGRGLEERCIASLASILSDHDPDVAAFRSGFSGLVKVHVRGARGAVRSLVAALEEEPWHNEVIKRAVPIDRVVPLDPKEIVSAARILKEKLCPGQEERFRVRVRKRGAPVDRMALITQVADLFDNRVDLERPDFELRVEMLRWVAGVSLLRRGEIFPDL